jgi:hypothetical protein
MRKCTLWLHSGKARQGIVINKECRFGVQQVSTSKTPGSGSRNKGMGAGQEQLSWHLGHAQELLCRVSIGNKYEGNVMDAHLSWHLGHAQELRWPQ